MTRKELTADIKKRVAAGESSNVIQRIRAAKIGKLNAAKMAKDFSDKHISLHKKCVKAWRG